MKDIHRKLILVKELLVYRREKKLVIENKRHSHFLPLCPQAQKKTEALTRLVLSRVTPCLSCSLGLDYSPLELIPRARARER